MRQAAAGEGEWAAEYRAVADCTLLPETGSLQFLGPPEFAAVDVAIKEINAAGGVLGNPVVNIRGDSGDDKTDTASQTVDRELNQDTQVIIGAALPG